MVRPGMIRYGGWEPQGLHGEWKQLVGRTHPDAKCHQNICGNVHQWHTLRTV